jgi:hypothetical protein
VGAAEKTAAKIIMTIAKARDRYAYIGATLVFFGCQYFDCEDSLISTSIGKFVINIRENL